jgi:CRP-like cAMP-binding protein
MGNKSSKTKKAKQKAEAEAAAAAAAAAPPAPAAAPAPTSMKAPGHSAGRSLKKAARRDSVRFNKLAIAKRANDTGDIRVGLTTAELMAQRKAVAKAHNTMDILDVHEDQDQEGGGGGGAAAAAAAATAAPLATQGSTRTEIDDKAHKKAPSLKSISTIDDPSVWQPGGYDTHHDISTPNGTANNMAAIKAKVNTISSGSESDSDSGSDYSDDELIEDWTQTPDDELVNDEYSKEEEVQINCIPETRFCTFFHQFTLEDQRVLLDVMEPRTFTDGQDVVTQGEMGNEFFIITEGEVVVLKCDRKTGEERDLTHLYRGQNFGEISMIYGGKRVASVRAVGKCNCLVLSKNVFEKQKHLRMFLITKKVPLLAELTQEDRISIVNKLQPRSFNEGDYVITQGDIVVDDAFYMITKGKCAVMDKEKTLTRLYEGHCFGEMALVLDKPRAASIMATTELKCMCLTKQDFQGALAGSVALANILKKFAAKRQRTRLQRKMSSKVIFNPRKKKLMRQQSLSNVNDFIKTKTCKAGGSFKKGTRQVNEYKFMKELGTGAFSTVYMATNTRTRQVVAIKVRVVTLFPGKVTHKQLPKSHSPPAPIPPPLHP